MMLLKVLHMKYNSEHFSTEKILCYLSTLQPEPYSKNLSENNKTTNKQTTKHVLGMVQSKALGHMICCYKTAIFMEAKTLGI